MKAFLLLGFAISLYANDIQNLIAKAYKNNPSLKSLELQIQSNQYNIKNSTLYKNPILSIGVNDINMDEPIDRSLEPMQTQYITISQEIIDASKLKQKEQITLINKKILQKLLKDKKDQISKGIYSIAFNINELEKKIKLNEKKIKNINKIKNYHDNHIQHKRAFQISLQNDLMIDTIKLSILNEREKIDQYYSKLSEIVNSKVTKIQGSFKAHFSDTIDKHTLLEIEELNIQKAHAKKQLARENKSSDYTLSAGYYHRDKYDDYVNISLKFPLNIYEKESNELQIALKELEISKSRYEELKNKLEKSYKIELSKNRLASGSLEYLEKIKTHLQKEKQLVSNRNTSDSLVEILSIENKIIENDIKYLSAKKTYEVSSVNLAYLTSTFPKE